MFQLHKNHKVFNMNSTHSAKTTTSGEEPEDIIRTSTGTTTTTGEEELEDTTSTKIKQEDGRFSFNEIYSYLSAGSYPNKG